MISKSGRRGQCHSGCFLYLFECRLVEKFCNGDRLKGLTERVEDIVGLLPGNFTAIQRGRLCHIGTGIHLN